MPLQHRRNSDVTRDAERVRAIAPRRRRHRRSGVGGVTSTSFVRQPAITLYRLIEIRHSRREVQFSALSD